MHFCPDASRTPRTGKDRRGRSFVEEWGWLGRAGNKQRRYVRRITLERPGEKALILVTDLVHADVYLADDLLQVYLMRWGIERVFQQITEVFELRRLIGTTPQGTVFQLSFCLLMYNLIQVVRGYIASAQGRPVETISTELLFADVHRQLIAVHEVMATEQLLPLIPQGLTAVQLRRRLERLFSSAWSDRWLKAPAQKPRPAPTKKGSKRDHTSVYRVLEACRRIKSSGTGG